ncbi:MAG: ABC transporter permease [Chloroflexi bacterium]|nr:ABC transporter permease [Chloroflexota bacterium]MCY3582313.1 ABC transporter permease [Chloroflexota bacterium]MCY3717896.1 ABC transporter permease [Chloroflexota bacterium]MDE2649106.1 ABC transporter permease [Chloroflexota bacterium]
MATFLLIRLLRWSVGLLLILFIAYAMMYYGAGDPIRMMFIQGEDFDSEDEVVMLALRKKYGLDDPFLVQFGNYLNNLLQGDWGRSIRLQVDRPVLEIVQFRLPISMQLGFAATVIGAVAGIGLGILSALYHNRWQDRLTISSVLFINGIPSFVIVPMLLYLLVLELKLIDVPYGWHGVFHVDAMLPIAVISIGVLPIVVRQTRSAMLEVKSQLYVRTARAKGMPESRIILRHMLRPVLTPVATTLGLIMISLINGSLFVEYILNIQGFGLLTIEGIKKVDYPIIMAVVVVGTLIIFVSNFLVDIIYPILDPRVRAQ